MARPTTAQQQALEVLQLDGYAYISNVTSSEHGLRHVYWQTGRWLVNQGYATNGWQNGKRVLEITDAGKEA